MEIYVTRRVTCGPNAQMTSISIMTSKNASNYYGFWEGFRRPTKTVNSFSVTTLFTSDINILYLCKIISLSH